jgi:hypothetical protein
MVETTMTKSILRATSVRIILPPSIHWSDAKSDMVTRVAKDAEAVFGRAIHHVDVVPDKTDPSEPFIIKIVFDLRYR